MKPIPAAATTIDPNQCPLCGGDNRCAMELERTTGQPQPPCWCFSAQFPADLLTQLPADKQNKACICARCLSAHMNAPKTASITTTTAMHKAQGSA